MYALGAALLAAPAGAHHRQTPPIVAITTSGDASLPRLPPASRKAAAIVIDAGATTSVTVVRPFNGPTMPFFAFGDGDNQHPSISSNGKTVAWDSNADPLASGAPGRQVVRETPLGLVQAAVDPTGTSANPALDRFGVVLAFESSADLAGTGNLGARQVFLRQPEGTIVQVSRGSGTSRNPSVGSKGRMVVFDSTSHPDSGADTGVAQIWIADLVNGVTTAVTAGAADSDDPILSDDGRVVVFASRADLAGDGLDTGATQVFAYDTLSHTFARVTGDAEGCTAPSALRIKRDWRIAYLCAGTAYFTMLRADQRFRVQTDGGDTTRLVPQADAHFVLVATTADLLAGGTTSEHRVYMVNLFARPPEEVASDVTWFPFQGIPPL